MPQKKRRRSGVPSKKEKKKARSNKKCTNPSWEIVQTKPDMEDVFRGILERIDPAEVYGCLKLLHNMHTSFGQIISNRGIISSFGGMVDIALINNLNLSRYLKVNVKKRINVNRTNNTDIHSLLWDASRKGLIGYYSVDENSAPVLCQIINPIRQNENRINIENSMGGNPNDIIINFVNNRNANLRTTYPRFDEMLQLVDRMKMEFEADIENTKNRVRKLTKKRIETIRKRYIDSIRVDLSTMGWNKKFALPTLYEPDQTDINKILENIIKVRNWGQDSLVNAARLAFDPVNTDNVGGKTPQDIEPLNSTFDEDIESYIVDYIFSEAGRDLYPIQAVTLTKDRIGSFLNSDIITVTEPEKFFLLPNYKVEVQNTLSNYISDFNPVGFAYEIPTGYFGFLGEGATIDSIDSVDSPAPAGETKSDITSTVQWRGFWQSIMRHNYKPFGSMDKQNIIKSVLRYKNNNIRIPGNNTGLTEKEPLSNPTPYCTIANKERLICGICGRPVGEKKWAETSSGGKGYDVDHVANLIFNELLGLNDYTDGLGFLNTCAKCNQTFKSEKIWSPSIELWNALNNICKKDRTIINDYPWPGLRNTGLIAENEIPFGGVRVYTIVNTYDDDTIRQWQTEGIDIDEVRSGEGYHSNSARRNVPAEIAAHELELLILDRYLKIAQTSKGQYMINMENGFIKKYTEKVSIIASGASYIKYQTGLTELLQNEVLRANQEYQAWSSQDAEAAVDSGDEQDVFGIRRSSLDPKSQAGLDREKAKRRLLNQSLQRINQNPQDFIQGRTSALAHTGVPVPFKEENVADMTSKQRKIFGNSIFDAWRQEKKRSRGKKSQEMIRNTIAERFATKIDSTNLFLLLDELKEEREILSNPSPPRNYSSPQQGIRGERKRSVANNHEIKGRILESILMYKAMNNGRSSLIPQKYIKQSGRGNTAVMDILTGNIRQSGDIIDSEVIGASGTATSQASFPKAKTQGTGTTRRIASLLGSDGSKSPELTGQASAPAAPTAAPAYGLRTPSPKKRGGSDTYGGGKGKTLKIRRRKKNTRRNRKNKNNKTKFKKRYKLKLTRRNK